MHRHILLVAMAALVAACSGGADAPVDRGAEPGAGGDAAVAPPGDVAAPAGDDAPPAGDDAPPAGDDAAPTGDDAPSVEAPPSSAPADRPGAGSAAGAPGARGPAGGAAALPASGAPASAPATAGDEGAAALMRAAAAYENVRSLRADFVMQFNNPLLRQQLTSRGAIYQRQPDRLAVRFTEPAGDLIVGDGQHFWVYYPSNNAQQVTRSPATAAGESAVNLQAQFVGNPVERFQYTLEGSEGVGGRQARVLLLVPRQRAQYRSLKVWVDNADSLVRRFEITEHNGSVRRFDLQNLQVNPAIPDGIFRFTPPDGVRVIDVG